MEVVRVMFVALPPSVVGFHGEGGTRPPPKIHVERRVWVERLPQPNKEGE